jgi:hypothetical protein
MPNLNWIKLPTTSKVSTTISSNSNYYLYLNDCISALDATHIALAANVPSADAAAYDRNRQGQSGEVDVGLILKMRSA